MAIEVPLMVAVPLALRPAETMLLPCAPRSGLVRASSAGPREEKLAMLLPDVPRPVAAMVSTFLALPGLPTLLPFGQAVASLPAANTTSASLRSLATRSASRAESS